MNLAAIEDMNRKFPHAELCFVESGGDNLAATFSPELADLTIYVIDVAEGEKIPRKRVELMLIESFQIGRLDFPNRDTLKSTHCFLPIEIEISHG